MSRKFCGSQDDSAVILQDVLPGSDLVFSVPIEFSSNRSGVYLEGREIHLEKIYEHLLKLIGVSVEDKLFGRWIGLVPPEDNRVIIHYEAREDLNKIQLLNIVLRNQLARVCNLCLSGLSFLHVKFQGKNVLLKTIILPDKFPNGEILLKPQIPRIGIPLH